MTLPLDDRADGASMADAGLSMDRTSETLLAGVSGVPCGQKTRAAVIYMRCIRREAYRWEEDLSADEVEVPTIRGGPIAKKAENQTSGIHRCLLRVFRTEGKNFSRDWRCQENLAGRLRAMPVICAEPCLGKLRENAAAVNGKKRSVVAGPGEEPAVGGEPESVDDVIRGSQSSSGRRRR